MTVPVGLKAYQTYLGLSLHFQRNGYDGWKYMFNGKVKAETFESNRGVMHRYASLESKHPTKLEQIKFMYPAFKYNGFVKKDDIARMTKEHANFLRTFNNALEVYEIELAKVACMCNNIDEMLGVYESLPVLYNAYIEKLISYDTLVLLTLAIPSINKIVSNEPFLWNSFLEKIKFDSKFYNLYLTDIEVLKQNTIAVLMSAWKLNRKGND